MTRKILWSLITMLTFTLAIWAGDISGKWTAQVPGRNGNMREVTFNLKASGEKLTGTMSGRNGDIEISEGRASEDNVSFSVTQEFGGNTFKPPFSCKITAGQILFK